MKLYKLYFIVILNISFLHSITSQSITLTPEMLWKLGRVSLDDISKDKKWVLYGISDYDLTANKSNRNFF